MLDAGNRVPGTDGDRGVNRREGRTCYCSETPPSLRVGAWRIGMSHVPTNVCLSARYHHTYKFSVDTR